MAMGIFTYCLHTKLHGDLDISRSAPGFIDLSLFPCIRWGNADPTLKDLDDQAPTGLTCLDSHTFWFHSSYGRTSFLSPDIAVP